LIYSREVVKGRIYKEKDFKLAMGWFEQDCRQYQRRKFRERQTALQSIAENPVDKVADAG
jgi:hypothetical protein